MSDAWQTPDELRDRLGDNYVPDKIYDDHNVHKRFNTLLEDLEVEARDVIENRLGDEPIAEEENRQETFIAPDTSTLQLVYPVQSVDTVETRSSTSQDWREFDDRNYRSTDSRLVLLHGFRNRRNPARVHRDRRTWADFTREVRVTYTRGYDPIPGNLINVQVDLIKRALRGLRVEQAISAADPEQMEAITNADMVLTDDLIERIDSTSTPIAKTQVI